MKIRTQLVLAFLLLAVVPLAGIVLYSYYSSLRAVRRAAETEARTLTREMDGRLAASATRLWTDAPRPVMLGRHSQFGISAHGLARA